MLADEVRLDLVSRSQRSGRRDVAGYVANYARFDDWYLVRGGLELKPSYYIELSVDDGLVTHIRDFRYVPYICVDAPIEVAERPSAGAVTSATHVSLLRSRRGRERG